MTMLVTTNLISAVAATAVVPDGIDDRQAGLRGNTVRTLVRNVPAGVTPKQVERQLDMTALREIGKPPRYVYDYADLPADDGARFPA